MAGYLIPCCSFFASFNGLLKRQPGWQTDRQAEQLKTPHTLLLALCGLLCCFCFLYFPPFPTMLSSLPLLPMLGFLSYKTPKNTHIHTLGKHLDFILLARNGLDFFLLLVSLKEMQFSTPLKITHKEHKNTISLFLPLASEHFFLIFH